MLEQWLRLALYRLVPVPVPVPVPVSVLVQRQVAALAVRSTQVRLGLFEQLAEP